MGRYASKKSTSANVCSLLIKHLLISGLTGCSIQTQMCIFGSMSIGETIIPTSDLAGALQIA